MEQNKKSSQYIWRTTHDNKVRQSHAARSGKIFSWDNPPKGGHSGEAYNCRCWAEPIMRDHDCEVLREKKETLEIQVKDLTEKFHDLLLRLDKLKEKNNFLIKNAQKALGIKIVTFILNLPIERIGILSELLQRYFDNIISAELLKGANDFMQQRKEVAGTIKYIQEQIHITYAMLEKASSELIITQQKLETCKGNEKNK